MKLKISLLAVSGLILMVLMLGGCAQQPAQQNIPPTQPSNPIYLIPPPTTFRVDVAPIQTCYELGEEINFKLRFNNSSSQPVILKYPPETKIRRREHGGLVYSWAAGDQEITVDAGETNTYTLTWNQKSKDGQQVDPGWYNISIDPRPITDVAMSVSSSNVLIQYPQGAMEKIIDVNQSQAIVDMPLTFGGEELLIDIDITLERVELSQEEAEFIVFATLKEWEKPQDIYTHPLWWGSSAGYNVDGIYHSLPGAGMTYLQDGIRYFWKGNPIPGYTQELIFIMNRLSEDWEGPWEFHVPLE